MKNFFNNNCAINTAETLSSMTIDGNKKLVVRKNKTYGEFCDFSMELVERVDARHSKALTIGTTATADAMYSAMRRMSSDIKDIVLRHISNEIQPINSNSKRARRYDALRTLGIRMKGSKINSYEIFNGMTVTLTEVSIRKNDVIDYEISFSMANSDHAFIIKHVDTLMDAIEEFANLKVKLSAIVIHTATGDNNTADRIIGTEGRGYHYDNLREMVNF